MIVEYCVPQPFSTYSTYSYITNLVLDTFVLSRKYPLTRYNTALHRCHTQIRNGTHLFFFWVSPSHGKNDTSTNTWTGNVNQKGSLSPVWYISLLKYSTRDHWYLYWYHQDHHHGLSVIVMVKWQEIHQDCYKNNNEIKSILKDFDSNNNIESFVIPIANKPLYQIFNWTRFNFSGSAIIIILTSHCNPIWSIHTRNW